MKRIVLFVVLLMILMMVPVAAAEPTSDPVILNLTRWYSANPMPTAPGITGEVVFKSPRSAVIVRQAPAGTMIAPHYHNLADEVVYVVEGSAELWSNGAWIKLQPGDVHANPRGAVHALKVIDAKGCKFVSVFAPPQPANGDMTFIPEGESMVGPERLRDANPGIGVTVGLKEWQSSPSGGYNQGYGSVVMPDAIGMDGMKSVSVSESPRSEVLLREAGYGASNRHLQDKADEIVIVVAGSAHVNINDNANTLAKNYLQIVPMGSDYRMNLWLGETIRFITVLALQDKTAGDFLPRLR